MDKCAGNSPLGIWVGGYGCVYMYMYMGHCERLSEYRGKMAASIHAKYPLFIIY